MNFNPVHLSPYFSSVGRFCVAVFMNKVEGVRIENKRLADIASMGNSFIVGTPSRRWTTPSRSRLNSTRK